MKGKIGIVILAAGDSRRLGQPKQLLPWKGGTLLEHIVNVALASTDEPVIVVLGAEQKRIRSVLLPSVKITVNPHWVEGVASSIREGVVMMDRLWPELQGVLFLSCDQPLVTVNHLSKMLTLFQQSDRTIVAATYAGTVGIPVIFSRNWFPKLRQLTGDQGAKVLLKKYPDDLATMSLPEAQWDIDDWETYRQIESMVRGEGGISKSS